MKNIIALVVAGVLLFGQNSQAQKKKEKDFEPKTISAHIIFAVDKIERDSNFVQALAYINEAIAMDSTNSFAHLVRANIYLIQRNYVLATKDFEVVIVADSEDFAGFLGRGKCRYFLKNYAGALADLNQAVKLEPFDADIYLWRSKVEKILGDETSSANDLRIYHEINAQ